MKVSIVIPVYNEALAIREVLRRVCMAEIPAGWEKEVIVVDDGSVDSTLSELEEFRAQYPEFHSFLHIHKGVVNHGKGVACRVGLKLVKGDVVLIQDGDLEYSPNDYLKLMEPFNNPEVQVVFGSRFHNGPPDGMRLPNLVANYILSATVRILYRQNLTDEATGYKIFRRSVLRNFDLVSRGFEFCPELTSKLLLTGHTIYEVPIYYNPRGILEGKKIRARDGFIAIWWLLKLRFSMLKRRQATSAVAATEQQ